MPIDHSFLIVARCFNFNTNAIRTVLDVCRSDSVRSLALLRIGCCSVANHQYAIDVLHDLFAWSQKYSDRTLKVILARIGKLWSRDPLSS